MNNESRNFYGLPNAAAPYSSGRSISRGGDRLKLGITLACLAAAFTFPRNAAAQSAQVLDNVRLSESSNFAPAAEWYNGWLYIAWTGTDGRLNLSASSDYQALSFPSSKKHTFSESSKAAPALISIRNTLFLAWTGTDNQIYIMSSPDGVNFSSPNKLGETSFVGPALATDSNKLYLAWTGTDYVIRVMSSSDGVNFPYSNRATLGETSYVAPAASWYYCGYSAACIGKLHIAWTGTDYVLRVMSSADGVNFPYADRQTLPQTSYVAPALREKYYANTGILVLCLGWTGTDNLIRVISADDQNGQSFGNGETLPSASSNAGPAILRNYWTTTRPGLYFIWTDKTSRINVGWIKYF